MLRNHICSQFTPQLDNGYLMSQFPEKICHFAADHAAADYQHTFSRFYFPFQHIRCMDCLFDSRNRKHQRIGAGCHNHCIRIFLANQFRCCRCIGFDFYTLGFTVIDVPANHAIDTSFSRRISRQTHISAQLLFFFV